MRKTVGISTLFALVMMCNAAFPQSVGADFDFVRYLIGNGMKKEAVVWAERPLPQGLSDSQADSLMFLKGWAFYSDKRLDAAAVTFSGVGVSSPLHTPALFMTSLSYANLNDYQSALAVLRTHGDTATSELCMFEQAGLSLLLRDYEAYDRYSNSFTYSDYRLAAQEKTLDSISFFLKTHKYKSPALAACLSAVVPGLGKIYCGRFGEGISAFITVGALGAITAENWVKYGPKNWKTILFGSFAVLFHVGNIYGSYASVNIVNSEIDDNQNVAIVYTIHIPLRNMFRL